MKHILIVTTLLLFTACVKQTNQTESTNGSYGVSYPGEIKRFSYYPAGELKPEASGVGREDSYIYAPGIRFPLESAPAYINSQVYGVGGMYGPPGSLCDQENFQYPWKDNYCEKRSWSMPMCHGGKGHQGDDIRPATCEKRKYYAVAVEDGIITYIGSYTVSLRGNSGRTYRYLHLDSNTLQVNQGEYVARGQRIGLVSDNMGGTSTSIHLHFDMRQTIRVGNESKQIFVPPYSSLVDAYKRLLDGRP